VLVDVLCLGRVAGAQAKIRPDIPQAGAVSREGQPDHAGYWKDNGQDCC